MSSLRCMLVVYRANPSFPHVFRFFRRRLESVCVCVCVCVFVEILLKIISRSSTGRCEKRRCSSKQLRQQLQADSSPAEPWRRHLNLSSSRIKTTYVYHICNVRRSDRLCFVQNVIPGRLNAENLPSRFLANSTILNFGLSRQVLGHLTMIARYQTCKMI